MNKTFNINRYKVSQALMKEKSIPMNFKVFLVFNGHRFTFFSQSTSHDVKLSKEKLGRNQMGTDFNHQKLSLSLIVSESIRAPGGLLRQAASRDMAGWSCYRFACNKWLIT